jgi:hypothetical protein
MHVLSFAHHHHIRDPLLFRTKPLLLRSGNHLSSPLAKTRSHAKRCSNTIFVYVSAYVVWSQATASYYPAYIQFVHHERMEIKKKQIVALLPTFAYLMHVRKEEIFPLVISLKYLKHR